MDLIIGFIIGCCIYAIVKELIFGCKNDKF